MTTKTLLLQLPGHRSVFKLGLSPAREETPRVDQLDHLLSLPVELLNTITRFNPAHISEAKDVLSWIKSTLLPKSREDAHTGQTISSAKHTQLLVASPYTAPQHLLDLRKLDDPGSILLALALTVLNPTRPDYARADFIDSFNLDECITVLRSLSIAVQYHWREQSFYIVTFRSRRKRAFMEGKNTGSDISALDQGAHAEAIQSGGLLKYWFGEVDEEGNNLATCFWRSRGDARAGGRGSGHAKAMAAAVFLYDNYCFDRWRLTIEDNVCLLYTSPSPRDGLLSRMPSSA